MTFTPKTWRDYPSGGTPVTAAELNRVERGVRAVADDVRELESRSGTSVAGIVQTFADLPDPLDRDGKAYYVVEPREGTDDPSPAMWVSNGTPAWFGPIDVTGKATAAAVADAVQTPTVLAALTGNGARPIGRGEREINAADYAHLVVGDDWAVAIDQATTDALASGKVLHIPPGTYRRTTPWVINRSCQVTGAGASVLGSSSPTKIVFAPGIDGIVIEGGTSGMMTSLTGLDIESESTEAGEGVGIRVRSGRANLTSVAARGFGSHGVYIDGDGANANICQLRQVVASRNFGNGFHTFGSGANANTFVGCDSIVNQGWGFFINSAHNLLLNPHTTSNTEGAYYDNGNTNCYILPYSEAGTGHKAEFGPNSSYPVWIDGGYGAATPDFVGVSASTSGFVVHRGGFTRRIRLHPPSGPNGGDTWELDASVYGTNTLRLRNTTAGQDIWRAVGGQFRTMAPMRVDGDVGFYGKTPVSRPALTYSRADESSAQAQIRTALATLGLVADNTTA